MPALNSDLLPPIFEQVLVHFGHRKVGAYVRQDIVRTLESGLVNAAAVLEREKSLRTIQDNGAAPGGPTVLKTSDRLSGADFSRTALVELLQQHTGLLPEVLEIALLLIEAQIDLRLKGCGKFKISGIEFASIDGQAVAGVADWSKAVLQASIQRATEDRPSIWSAFSWRRNAGIQVLVETIQLGAAQRDALPYRVTIDRTLIEPLLAEPRNGSTIRLLHVSDLHLALELREEGRKLPSPVGAPTHSFEAARLVAGAVRSLSPRYDLLVATGDLTTDGTRASFETVLQYVQGGSIAGDNPMRIASYGLGASKSQRILLPGNHDRYAGKLVIGQRLDDEFERALETPRTYPYVVGFRPLEDQTDALTLLFFVFDSTLPEGRKGNTPSDWFDALAVGEVSWEEVARAEELAKQVAEKKIVDRLVGDPITFDPSRTVRIALLHHHPVVTYHRETLVRRKGLFARGIDLVREYRDNREASLVQMKGGDEFLAGCLRMGIQLVCFGHQHYPYRRLVAADKRTTIATPFGNRVAALRAFCCPTALQYDAKGNGFYIYDIVDEATVVWTSIGSLRSEGRLTGPMEHIESESIQLDGEPEPDERATQHVVNV